MMQKKIILLWARGIPLALIKPKYDYLDVNNIKYVSTYFFKWPNQLRYDHGTPSSLGTDVPMCVVMTITGYGNV